jgi:hypothetical protein
MHAAEAAHSFSCGSGEHFACGLEEIELIIQPLVHEDSLAGFNFREPAGKSEAFF